MWLDILIAVLLAASTLGSAYMGLRVTLHGVESEKSRKRHKIAFWGLGIVSVILIGLQTTRNALTQKNLSEQLGAIKHNTETPPKVQITNNLPPPTVLSSQSDQAIFFLDCARTALPIDVPKNRDIVMYDPVNPYGFGVLRLSPHDGDYWPQTSQPAGRLSIDFIYKCGLVNYSIKPVFNVRGAFGIRVLDLKRGVKARGSYQCGDEADKAGFARTQAGTDEIDANGGVFYFLLTNNAKDKCAEFSIPSTVSFEGRNGRETAKVTLSATTKATRLILFPVGMLTRLEEAAP